MSLEALNKKIQDLSTETDRRKSLDIAIEAANEVVKIIKPSAENLFTGEDALDRAIPVNQFPNHKIENWFNSHPYFTGDKVALRFYEDEIVETKFYWLNDTSTKARVSAGVMLTPNWEDSELTRNDNYKLGLDFFLTHDTKSLLVVISNMGNLRILELNNKLSHTQHEILTNLKSALQLETKEQSHKILWDSLALSEVNKKFYAGVAEQFNILLNHLITSGKDKEDAKLFASRLLGRLLFIWFLRRKNIIDEKFGYFELSDNNSTDYYDSKLKILFFETLNVPTSERSTGDGKTPYLNGGLFEAHHNDWNLEKISFPTGYFNGLYEHLEKYNFTTDESSPEYEQVAIDPEMLGQVFESLLATQITDTGAQARKAKGTYYTPREIVSYMCKESLRQYIYRKIDNEQLNEGIDKLLDTTDSEWELSHSNSKRNLWGEANRNTVPLKVIGALNELKVLDPACGSGAFPMVMLHQILNVYQRLDSSYDPYRKKLQIIKNNLFGVDIEPMAVEISRLRAWLSLIVDETALNNIEPLPNLDFKFVCANSLLPLESSDQSDLFSPDIHDDLIEVKNKYYNARSVSSKEEWKSRYYKLTDRDKNGNPMSQDMFANNRKKQLFSFEPFKNIDPANFFNPEYMFGESEFDIIIGNPPYGAKVKEAEKELFKKTYLSTKTIKNKQYGSFDTYVLFTELAFNLAKKNGVVWLIIPMSITSSENTTALHNLLYENCSEIKISSYADRPQQIFQSAHQRVSIISFVKDYHENEVLLTTKMHRKTESISIRSIIENLSFVNIKDVAFYGRIPKIGSQIEIEIYKKLRSIDINIGDIRKTEGKPVYYRSSGGDFYKIFTDHPTGSTKDKAIYFNNDISSLVGATLLSSLYYWYQKSISNILDIKIYEIDTFPIPIDNVDPETIFKLDNLFTEFNEDIERHALVRKTNSSRTKVKEFKEYKLRKSKKIIDKIDDLILPKYGLNAEEIEFIKNFEKEFRG